jgi:isoquinoline 1-oxidoreductase subunit beta
VPFDKLRANREGRVTSWETLVAFRRPAYHPAMSATTLSRRTLIVGGGAGVGLVVAWALWPRAYAPNLAVAPGETLFNAFLKIGRDGRVIVAVPQAEIGQGVYTSLPQILADELGADWRTVAVEPAPLSPLYANPLLAAEHGPGLPSAFQGIGDWAVREYATRTALMLTGGSTSVRAFEPRLREAGAAARALLSMAAADRWDVDWEGLDTAGGFVLNGQERLSFAELAEAASGYDLPPQLPVRGGTADRLAGEPLTRLDAPAKVDGSALFAGDVRLPDMVYASLRAGPIGATRLGRIDRAAAERMPGLLAIVEQQGWVGAVATNWWAADRAVQALQARFAYSGLLADTLAAEAELGRALSGERGTRIFERGDLAAVAGSGGYSARYSAGAAPNAAIETLAATARFTEDRLEVWAPTQAPGLARAAAARAAGLAEARVTLYPTLIGGGYGRKIETAAIEQAVLLARAVRRPVQLVWSRAEEMVQDSVRPPVAAKIGAWLREGRRIVGWQARIAAPDTAGEVRARLAGRAPEPQAHASAITGAVPPYAIPALAIDHVPVSIGLRTGLWRGGAHAYTAFFTESFIDEIARLLRAEPLSFRIGLLTENPRLARVLSTAAALGGWDGGGPGSRLGLAAHSAFGSHAALLVEAAIGPDRRIRISRAVCAVDCGRVVNPEIVRQLIEGGIVHGIAGATGAALHYERGRPDARRLRDLQLPTLADCPEIVVEIVDSQEPPGGVTELAVAPVAPALANAIYASTGRRARRLPFDLGAA